MTLLHQELTGSILIVLIKLIVLQGLVYWNQPCNTP